MADRVAHVGGEQVVGPRVAAAVGVDTAGGVQPVPDHADLAGPDLDFDAAIDVKGRRHRVRGGVGREAVVGVDIDAALRLLDAVVVELHVLRVVRDAEILGAGRKVGVSPYRVGRGGVGGQAEVGAGGAIGAQSLEPVADPHAVPVGQLGESGEIGLRHPRRDVTVITGRGGLVLPRAGGRAHRPLLGEGRHRHGYDCERDHGPRQPSGRTDSPPVKVVEGHANNPVPSLHSPCCAGGALFRASLAPASRVVARLFGEVAPRKVSRTKYLFRPGMEFIDCMIAAYNLNLP